MRNVTGEDQPLDVSVQAPAGAEIIVAGAEKKGGAADKSDKTIAVDAGAERLIQITIKAPTLANGQYFGQITLTPKKKSRSPAKGASAARKAFWARPANAELDRSGDWLLKNLSSTRAKAASRAGPT